MSSLHTEPGLSAQLPWVSQLLPKALLAWNLAGSSPGRAAAPITTAQEAPSSHILQEKLHSVLHFFGVNISHFRNVK